MIEQPPNPLPAGRYVLRPWRPEDAEWYVRARDDLVFEWTTETHELTCEAVVDAIVDNLAHPLWIGLAIAEPDGTPLGNISLVPQSDGWAEASYWLAPEGRGRGAAAAALLALARWAIASQAFDGVFLKIAPDNAASIAVALRCDFVQIGSSGERLRFERRS